MFFLFTSTGFTLLGGMRNDSHLRREWLAQRQIVKQSSISVAQRQGFLHLLRSFCDCLLHLGPDLEIMEPCPNLAAMLFLTDGRPLEGVRFCDFIASEEDRNLFVVAMGKETSEKDPAGILPLHLRDSQSREVQVHVHYTSFIDQDDARYRIIAVTEAEAWQNAARPVEETGALHRGSTATERTSVASAESGSDASESDITLEPVAGPDLGEISVTFEADAGFTIISCTPGFTGLCGPVGVGPQLVDWTRGEEPFFVYAQVCANAFYSLQHATGPLYYDLPTQSVPASST